MLPTAPIKILQAVYLYVTCACVEYIAKIKYHYKLISRLDIPVPRLLRTLHVQEPVQHPVSKRSSLNKHKRFTNIDITRQKKMIIPSQNIDEAVMEAYISIMFYNYQVQSHFALKHPWLTINSRTGCQTFSYKGTYLKTSVTVLGSSIYASNWTFSFTSKKTLNSVGATIQKQQSAMYNLIFLIDCRKPGTAYKMRE